MRVEIKMTNIFFFHMDIIYLKMILEDFLNISIKN